MLRRLRKKKVPLITPDELDAQTAEFDEYMEKEGARIKAIAAFLERRRLENGFGLDFEYTLRPKES